MRSVLQTQGDSRWRSCPVVWLVPGRLMDVMLPAGGVPDKHSICRYIIACGLHWRLGILQGRRGVLGDRRRRTMSPSQGHGVAETIHLTEQDFDKTLMAAQGLVMVDFWAEWCGPCRAIAPVLEELAEASEGRVTLMKVNVDENHGLATRYGIQSIPTILFFKEGAVVDRVLGAAPRAELQSVVNARA